MRAATVLSFQGEREEGGSLRAPALALAAAALGGGLDWPRARGTAAGPPPAWRIQRQAMPYEIKLDKSMNVYEDEVDEEDEEEDEWPDEIAEPSNMKQGPSRTSPPRRIASRTRVCERDI